MISPKTISPVIDEKSIKKVAGFIKNSNNIVITTHLSPDGDALGSSLALYHFLKNNEKNVSVIVPNSFPYFLEWMEGADQIINYEFKSKTADRLIENADLIFSLDYNIPKRIGRMAESFISSHAAKILIDHHLLPGDCFDVIISYPQISSTSELIFRTLYQAGEFEAITRTIAECIYCGMMTDTGGFTFNSNNPEIYEIISLLLQKGIDKDVIYSRVFHNYNEERFRLLGYTLSQRMKTYPELHTALIWLSLEDQKQFVFSKGDTEGFVNYPLNIQGIVFSVFIREDENLIKISFRSQGSFPSNEFAASFFNGGGHLNASGGEFHGTMQEAITLFEEGLLQYREKLKETTK